ncbi:MAG TPA: ubiquinone/menaquinone biosynthesis methyltransferase [Acidimicrobiales bacterium]|nr:ubiquinone/menaquinone biosynthesis methyltransferase [Acidimicrobiales bacterium]
MRGPAASLPEGDAKTRAVRSMFDAIAPRYDLLNRLLTFRLDVGWRRRAVRELRLAPGSLVLDVAAGTGDLARELRHRELCPVALDLSAGMLAAARTDAPRVQADASALPLPEGSVDGVTCGFALRNFTDLEACLNEMARVLRDQGRVALIEVSTPRNPLMRFGHAVYFGKVVPAIGALLSDRAAYQYLPKSVAYLPPTAGLLGMLVHAGFDDVEHVELSGGIAQLITATRSAS